MDSLYSTALDFESVHAPFLCTSVVSQRYCTKDCACRSMLTLPLHDSDKVSNMALRIKIGAFVLPVTFLIVVCVELFGCSPVQKHWQIYPDPGST